MTDTHAPSHGRRNAHDGTIVDTHVDTHAVTHAVTHAAAASDAAAVSRARSCRAPLAAWWDATARDFPWRFGRTTPWGVLLSEVMSQQTPMARVLPFWTAWMDRWPTPAALADATPAEVITAWGSLGYPRRALRLRECAIQVRDRYDGDLPRTYDELVALPGVGDYTASAVLSFAFGRRVAVIDTNIRRVLQRAMRGVESLGGSTTAADRRLAQACLPDDASASVVWNEAVMELGAVTCTASSPACADCPVADICAFRAAGYPGLGQRRTRPRQRFAGTDRQVRGIVLNALRQAGPGAVLPYATVRGLWKDRAQLDACLASLDDDGLIVIGADHGVRLPEG